MAPQPKASADSPSDLLGVKKMGVWSASTQYNSLTDIYFPPVQSQTSMHSTTDQSLSVFPRMHFIKHWAEKGIKINSAQSYTPLQLHPTNLNPRRQRACLNVLQTDLKRLKCVWNENNLEIIPK
jgi:hypothetical protein